MSKRLDTLLSNAATEFENLRNPFDTEWLAKNNVTLDECGDLSERIAHIIRGYLKSPESVQFALLLIGS